MGEIEDETIPFRHSLWYESYLTLINQEVVNVLIQGVDISRPLCEVGKELKENYLRLIISSQGFNENVFQIVQDTSFGEMYKSMRSYLIKEL
jgi:hypothetical protein